SIPHTTITINNTASNTIHSSNVSRHAGSPNSSTTVSDEKTIPNVPSSSPSVRKITTMTSGGKTLGFFGSLSPKSSKHKISNKKAAAAAVLVDSSHPVTPAPPSSPFNYSSTPLATLFPPNHLLSPNSHSPIPTTSFQLEETATTPTSQRLQSAVSSNMSSPSGKQSLELPDSHQPVQQPQLQQERHQQPHDSSKDKSDKKRAKDKDRPHSHFGQRLSKAIGFSSSSSKNQQQQQRLRQLSVDILSKIDAIPCEASATTTESPQQPQQVQKQTGKPTPEKEKERERKGGIINNFLHRPRILSSNEGPKMKGSPHTSAGSATTEAGAGVGVNMATLGEIHINSFRTPDATFAQSATNSEVSLDSEAAAAYRRASVGGHGADGSRSADDSDTVALREFQSRHRQDRGSSSSGKSLVQTLTASSFRRRPSLIVDLMPLSFSSRRHHRQQLQQKMQPLPSSMADMVESTLEVHPHHQPGDMERLNLYSQLGLQEMHYNTDTGEEPSEKMIRQLYGNASALRKDHSSTSFLSSQPAFGTIDPKDHPPRRASTPGGNLSGSYSPITSNASTLGATMASPVPLSKTTSSRLGKLGRFKFLSLSMGSIHRHKHGSATGSTSSIQSTSEDQQQHAMMLANFNNNRRSSLSISFKSSIFAESTIPPVTVPPPPLPTSHIHVSDSASTFASVNTAGITTMGPSTVGSNSNHSSISSSYNAFEAASGGAGKPRQSLSSFLEEQTHQPHRSSTNGLVTTAVAPHSSSHQRQQQIQRSSLANQDAAVPGKQQQQQQHNGHPRQQSWSLGKSFTGSENFNANTTTNASFVTSNGSSSGSSSGQHQQGISLSFRSGLLRRSSRRTVSASHISSKNIFGPDATSTSQQEAAALAHQDLMELQAQGGEAGSNGAAEGRSTIRHFKSERDMLSAALLQGLAAVDAVEVDAAMSGGDARAEEVPTEASTASVVGQYLFGDDCKNLSFGERDAAATLVKVDSAVDTTTAAADVAESGPGLKMAHENTILDGMLVIAAAAQPAVAATPTAPSASSTTTIATDHQDKALLSRLLSVKKKSDYFLTSEKVSGLSTPNTPLTHVSLPTSTEASSSSPTHLYATDSKAAPGSGIIPRDRMVTLDSKAISQSKLQQQQHQEPPTTPTQPAFAPRSPAAVFESHKCLRSPGYNSPSPVSLYSSYPPVSATPIPAPGTTPTKPKFSILGPSATSGAGFSYLQNRPSLSLTMASSSAASPSSHHGVGSSSSSTLHYMPHHSSSVPLPGKSGGSDGYGSNSASTTILHLEPRSAVVDYRPAIHYKRQRSMSLQDVDLLTADQFIALMPDDTPAKRSNFFSIAQPFVDIFVLDFDPVDTLSFRIRVFVVFSSHRVAEEKDIPLAASPSERILIRIQGVDEDLQRQQAASAFKETGADRRVSVDEMRNRGHDGERGSLSSSLAATAPGGTRPKRSSLMVSGSSGTNPPHASAAPPETTPPTEEPNQENANHPSIDVDQIDIVETVGMLFDEMDQIMTRMVEMLAKYISTDQFSKLLKESDEICYQAQEVCRVELDRRYRQRLDLRRLHHQQQQQQQQQEKQQQMQQEQHKQQQQQAVEHDAAVEVEVIFEHSVSIDQQPSSVLHQPQSQTQPQKLEFSKRPMWAASTELRDCDHRQDPPHPLLTVQHYPSPLQRSTAPMPAKTTTEPVAIPTPLSSSSADAAETGDDGDDSHVKKKDSNDRICHRRNRNHYKHYYRYQSQGQGCTPGEGTDTNGEIMSSEEHQGAVYDYIWTVLTMADVSMAEYMRIYNRMLVVPTNGYRIEGCNDLKKIERSMRSDHAHIAPLSITTAVSSESSQPSLLGQISAVQNTTNDMTALSPGSTTSTATPAVDYSSPDPSGFTPSASASTAATAPSTAARDTGNQEPSPTMNNIFSPSNAVPSGGGGQAMVRVKSLPESKDGWAALQKRKEMGGSPGVAGAISMGTPAAVGITISGVNNTGFGIGIGGGVGGIGATGAAAAGVVTGTGISMMGECSKEHMGHEAYYYRNWFLGKEHRTFVGQVEGLGTVIISIIKDMVVTTETARPQFPSRSSTSPNSLTHHSSFVSPPNAGSSGSGSASHSAGLNRPELVHSAQSFYPGRGSGGYHGPGVGGSGMIASPRTSSEAMRIILAASTAVASGAGSSSNAHASSLPGVGASYLGTGLTMGSSHLAPSTPSTPGPHSLNALQPNHHSGSNNSNNTNASPRWQYRCILRQKDVDSIRITLPEPEPGPLNNLTRRAGKPQWKTILQSIHPAITQQVASKLKKVQNNPHFEMELAKFDETMLRFNYKFGVLLVHPGQTKEEDWFSNQMSSSPRFQEFLESGALGQKVALKGFERFSAGLDTRGEGGEYSYYDTWGEGFEIMYHVSTLLPYNTVDRQQIQRKRHIGNDIVCIIFVDGDQPFVPNAIKSQFLHIFVIIRQIVLPDGNKAYSAAVTCDEQVPEFGPPLPDPPIFRTPAELRAFLLCKMINGENAAYKAPRLIKPHQRARSGMLENLVAKANTLAKVKDIDKKLSKQQKAAATSAATTSPAIIAPTTPSTLSGSGPSSVQHTLLSMSSVPNLTPSHPNAGGTPCSQQQQHGQTPDQFPEGHGYIESLMSLPSPMLGPASLCCNDECGEEGVWYPWDVSHWKQ
ncbi:Rap/ran-GAP protein, partial [Mortierella sp. 14UC]